MLATKSEVQSCQEEDAARPGVVNAYHLSLHEMEAEGFLGLNYLCFVS